MSKVDGLRALREARYAATRAGGSQPEANKAARTKPTKAEPPTVDELCGKPAGISGKRCIRPKDHTEKNHRYAKVEPR